MKQKRVAVLGAGAWGTAVAQLLADNGYDVVLWCFESELADSIAATGYNDQFLPEFLLSKRITATADIVEAVRRSTLIFEAIPVSYLRETLAQVVHCVTPEQTWIVLSKGIERGTLLLPTQIIDELFDKQVETAVFSGPSFAQDVCNKQYTAVTIAAFDCAVGQIVQDVVAHSYFRPYRSEDPIGAQVGGAVKNVIAIGVGLLQGAGYTDNAQAFLLTRGLAEMVQIAQVLGGAQETVYGLSGVGDLVLTAMGKLSRNVAFGRRIGAGESVGMIKTEGAVLPEGVTTVQSVMQLAQRYDLKLPICFGVGDVIFSGKTVEQFLSTLMAQPLERECV